MPDKKDTLPLALLSILIAIPTPAIIIGISLSSTMNSAIIVNTNPLWVALFAPLLVAARWRARDAVAIVVGIIGVALTVLNGQDLSTILRSEYFLGSCVLLFAALCISCYSIFAKSYVVKYGGLFIVWFTTGVGALICLVYCVLAGSIPEFFELGSRTYLYAFLLGTISTALPYFLFNSSLKHLELAAATSFKLLIPIFAAVYALLLLDEVLTVWILSGMLLTSIGVYTVQHGRHQPK